MKLPGYRRRSVPNVPNNSSIPGNEITRDSRLNNDDSPKCNRKKNVIIGIQPIPCGDRVLDTTPTTRGMPPIMIGAIQKVTMRGILRTGLRRRIINHIEMMTWEFNLYPLNVDVRIKYTIQMVKRMHITPWELVFQREMSFIRS